MTQPTTYRRSLSGSVGAGMKSVFGGEGRRYYMLVHKVSSKYHKAGEAQRIIVDQIEIGRDPKCQVRFDESFTTVSRRHAAIVKDGDNWKLVQLSQTNSTYLNGRRVEKEWYLQNGDEIQLSTNGPKLGFIVPEGEKGKVSSIGLTARLNLFRKQALRPYKNALAALGCLLVLCCGVGGYFLHASMQKNKELEEAYRLAQEEWERQKEEWEKRLIALDTAARNLEADVKKWRKIAERTRQEMDDIEKKIPRIKSVDNEAINKVIPNVYFVEAQSICLIYADGSQEKAGGYPGWGPGTTVTGTGFLLEDGRFVTARHVVEPYFYPNDGLSFTISRMVANGEIVDVQMDFVAVSSTGNSIRFTTDNLVCDRSQDQIRTTENEGEDGKKVSIPYMVASLNATDYAYVQTNLTGGLAYDGVQSDKLERGTELTVLGFPLGKGADGDEIKPVYGSAIVASEGLQPDGKILTTNTNYEHGNSGGPVFYMDDNGELVVIGIVSTGEGRALGGIVPISVIR